MKSYQVLKLDKIKPLVSYYQLINKKRGKSKSEKNVLQHFFDKEKLHELFYNNNVFYSEISDKELYFLPLLKKIMNYLFLLKIIFMKKLGKIFSKINL